MEHDEPNGHARGSRRPRVAALVALVAIVVLGALVAALHDRVARQVAATALRGFGYAITFGTLHVGLSRAVADGVRVTTLRGEPVLTARHIAVAYSLRDLLPGGKRLFGLTAVTIDAPHVTVIHHSDGSYNLTLPPANASNAKPSTAVLDVRLHVSGGSVDVIDRFITPSRERRVRLIDVTANGTLSGLTPSRYRGGAVFVDADGARYPIAVTGRFDDARGFEVQHAAIARLPIAALANFALSTHAFTVEGGELDGIDATYGALATPAGPLQTHLGLRARLRDGRVAATALTKPVRDARASIVVDDDGATVRSLDASLNGIALHARGALFHFAQPQVRFALTASGDLARLRALSNDSARLPIDGRVVLRALAEGPAANPLIVARFRSPLVAYGAYRLTAPRGFVAVSGQELDVLAADAAYGPIGLRARGSVRLQPHTETAAYALVNAPADTVPYVDNLVPGMALTADAVVRGSDQRLGVRGDLGGSDGADRLDVPFSVAPDGSGTLGPLALARRDGASVYLRAAFDRAARQTVALADVRALSLEPAPARALPGFAPPPLPRNLDARLDAALAGVADGASLSALAGSLHASGSWGDLRADAGGSGRQLAARGRLTSSFERLAALGVNAGASGGIDIPFAVAGAPGAATVVQVSGARFPGGRLHGIALDGADATVRISPDGHDVEIAAAEVRAGGASVTARGRLGAGGRVQLTAGDLDLAVLRAAGIPYANGRATLIADIGGTVARPVGTLIAALGGASYRGVAIGGDAGLAYAGGTLRVDRATLTYGGAYAAAGGSVSDLRPGRFAPRYDLHARLEDADVATLARTVKAPLRYPEGTLDADVRVGGAGTHPTLAGTLRLPEGSLNGLYVHAGRVAFSGDATRVAARNGQLVVGGTTLHFAARATRRAQSVRLRTEHLDLADFNDYFDEADVLAGTGGITLAADASPASVSASADVSLRDLRYRRFALGDAGATVRTNGDRVRVAAGLSGTNGRLHLAGDVVVPATDPLRDIVRRSSVDLDASIAGLNLGRVLPAAGFDVPVFGTIDGAASVRGRYPALALSAHATLVNGIAGRLPIQRLTLAAAAADGRGRLTELDLVAPGLAAQGTGSFGLTPSSAFAFDVRATSADVATLAGAATGKDAGVHGALDLDAHAAGTIAAPRLTATLDARQLTYRTLTVSSVHADLAATRQSVDVRNGDIVLARGGTIAFDGRAPLATGAATPVAFDLAPRGVDIAPYSSLLPDGSVVAGVFDGNVSVRGTLSAPLLGGSLTFARGSYRSNTLTKPLTDVALQLDFSGTRIRIAKLHAHAGSGNFDGSGAITLGDLRDPLPGLRANVDVTAENASITAPKFYTGAVDGSVTLTKQRRAPAVVGGNLRFSSARIPYTALLPSGGGSTGATPTLPDVAFDLGVTVGRDVRVQSGPVDIGTTGSARLGGTLAKPTLDGQFSATDGTVSVYRTFVVQNGSTVTFSPSDGITPSVDATAVTQISDPATNVLLHVTGLSTHLNLAFSSEPPYTQEQILGLLVNAQALGAVSGVAQTSGGTAGPSISGIGEGLLNEQFTQKFLQPFSSKVGGALGLSDLNLNYNTNGAVSAVARRAIGKNVSFTYGEQIGGPTPRTSLGINIGNGIAGAQLTFYEAAGSQQAFGGQALTPFLQSGFLATTPPNYTLQAIEPPTGSGFVFSYQRRFW